LLNQNSLFKENLAQFPLLFHNKPNQSSKGACMDTFKKTYLYITIILASNLIPCCHAAQLSTIDETGATSRLTISPVPQSPVAIPLSPIFTIPLTFSLTAQTIKPTLMHNEQMQKIHVNLIKQQELLQQIQQEILHCRKELQKKSIKYMLLMEQKLFRLRSDMKKVKLSLKEIEIIAKKCDTMMPGIAHYIIWGGSPCTDARVWAQSRSILQKTIEEKEKSALSVIEKINHLEQEFVDLATAT